MRLPGPLTTKAFGSLPPSQQAAGGAGGSTGLQSLQQQDAALRQLYLGEWPPSEPPEFVRVVESARPPTADVDVDVAVCGGTLGILLACALQRKGHSVAVVEAGPLRGRDQDWNTSLEELMALVDEGVIDASDLARVAPIQFGPMACKFGPRPALQLELSGVLDVGVSPAALLHCVRSRFERAGGIVLERAPLRDVTIHPDGARCAIEPIGATGEAVPIHLHARLVVDAMGHRSRIALQQRAGQRPDGVCVQVGCAARGPWRADSASRGDFFVTTDDAVYRGPNRRARVQYFRQAFPSSAAPEERSSYLFTYFRPGAEMPSLLEVMEEYWRTLPAAEGGRLQTATPSTTASTTAGGRASAAEATAAEEGAAEEGAAAVLDTLEVSRILFGWFPIYRRNAPLAPCFDRILSVGDASAVQSPISFGGFCAMLRHLPRYSRGIDLALASDQLRARNLALLAPYLPNLGTAWMSAAAMTARTTDAPPMSDDGAERAAAPSYALVNRLLEGNFKVGLTLSLPGTCQATCPLPPHFPHTSMPTSYLLPHPTSRALPAHFASRGAVRR